MGRVRQGTLGHGPVQDHGIQAARQRDAEPERRLLGKGSRAQARQDGPVPDAGGDDAACRAALGPGRLDRGAAARCRAQPEGRRVRDRHRQLSAHVALGVQPRQGRFAVEGRARAPGAQLLPQPRGIGDAAERPRRAVRRRLQAGRPPIRQARRSSTSTIRRRPRRCSRTRATAPTSRSRPRS